MHANIRNNGTELLDVILNLVNCAPIKHNGNEKIIPTISSIQRPLESHPYNGEKNPKVHGFKRPKALTILDISSAIIKIWQFDTDI